MRTQTLSDIFQAVAKLERAVAEVAAYDTMVEEDAQVFLGMIDTCTKAANVSLETSAPPQRTQDMGTPMNTQ
jgi:hypothetical protein